MSKHILIATLIILLNVFVLINNRIDLIEISNNTKGLLILLFVFNAFFLLVRWSGEYE